MGQKKSKNESPDAKKLDESGYNHSFELNKVKDSILSELVQDIEH